MCVFVVLLHLRRLHSRTVVVVIERRGIGRRADMWINMFNVAKYRKATQVPGGLALRSGYLICRCAIVVNSFYRETMRHKCLAQTGYCGSGRTMPNVDWIATRSGCVRCAVPKIPHDTLRTHRHSRERCARLTETDDSYVFCDFEIRTNDCECVLVLRHIETSRRWHSSWDTHESWPPRAVKKYSETPASPSADSNNAIRMSKMCMGHFLTLIYSRKTQDECGLDW